MEDTGHVCVNVSADYTNTASAITSYASRNPHCHTVHVMSDSILRNPTKCEFDGIVRAVSAMPNLRCFSIFCWSIPRGSSHGLAALARDKPLLSKISIAHNIMCSDDHEALDHAMMLEGVAGRVSLENGHVIN